MPLTYLSPADVATWRELSALARGYARDAIVAAAAGNGEAAGNYRRKSARFRAEADALGTPGLPPDRTGQP